MFQVGHVGPMLGQAHHFHQYAPETIPYAMDCYTNEAARLYGVMDRRLAEADYFAGDEYTIVDMAAYPWIVPYKMQGQKKEDFPNLTRWYESIKARSAVQRALNVGKELRRPAGELDEKAREALFGNRQHTER